MAFQKFPLCLYKPGSMLLAGYRLQGVTVASEEELSAALGKGYFESFEAACAASVEADKAAAEAERKAAEKAAAAGAQREDLERQATELGITFTPRTSDKRLAAEIAEKRGQG